MASEEWWTALKCQQLLNANQHTIMKYALLGKIRHKVLPTQSIRYLKADVEKLAREMAAQGTAGS